MTNQKRTNYSLEFKQSSAKLAAESEQPIVLLLFHKNAIQNDNDQGYIEIYKNVQITLHIIHFHHLQEISLACLALSLAAWPNYTSWRKCLDNQLS